VIYLDSITKKLEIVLGGAVATNQPHVTVCFYDVPSQIDPRAGERLGGVSLNKTNNASAVTICAAPPIAGTTRNIRYICIYNADSGSVTPSIQIDDGGTDYIQYSQALAAGKSLVYEDSQGWLVL
jgi:hypothetical protein